MKYRAPFGASDPEASYINGNPAIGLKGSIIDGRSLEETQRELVDFITKGGLTPSFTDLGQLAKASQTGKITYAVAGGTANALTATLSPAPAALVAGMTIRLLIAAANTGAATLAIAGLGAKDVVRPNGDPLQQRDLAAGMVALLHYDGTRWQVIGANARPTLTANQTIYVDGANGSDANDGTAPDAAHALRTIQKAVNVAWSYGPSEFVVTIQVAAWGTSYGNAVTPIFIGPPVRLRGTENNYGNVVIDGGLGHCVHMRAPSTMDVEWVTVKNDAGNSNGGFVASAGVLRVRNTKSLAITGAVFQGFVGGKVIAGNHDLAGNVSRIYLGYGGNVEIESGAVVRAVSPISVVYTAQATWNGLVFFNDSAELGYASFSGSVTGTRYYASANGVIQVNGAGASYLPGTVAGSTATGGQYL